MNSQLHLMHQTNVRDISFWGYLGDKPSKNKVKQVRAKKYQRKYAQNNTNSNEVNTRYECKCPECNNQTKNKNQCNCRECSLNYGLNSAECYCDTCIQIPLNSNIKFANNCNCRDCIEEKTNWINNVEKSRKNKIRLQKEDSSDEECDKSTPQKLMPMIIDDDASNSIKLAENFQINRQLLTQENDMYNLVQNYTHFGNFIEYRATVPLLALTFNAIKYFNEKDDEITHVSEFNKIVKVKFYTAKENPSSFLHRKDIYGLELNPRNITHIKIIKQHKKCAQNSGFAHQIYLCYLLNIKYRQISTDDNGIVNTIIKYYSTELYDSAVEEYLRSYLKTLEINIEQQIDEKLMY